jgi:predicted RecB family nuclease
VEDTTLTLLVISRFHQNQIEAPRNYRLLQQTLSNHLGISLTIVCSVSPPPESPPSAAPTPTPATRAASPARRHEKREPPPEPSPDTHDITCIPHISRTTTKALQRSGITTIAQVVRLSVLDWQRLPGVSKKQAKLLHASVQAITTGQPVAIAPPQNVLPGFESFQTKAGLFFDLESQPGSYAPYAFGTMTPDGAAHIALLAPHACEQPAAPLVIEQTTIAFVATMHECWLHILQQAQHTPGQVMHWGAYEQTCLRNSAAPSLCEQIMPRLFDVHQELTSRVALPLTRKNGKKSGGGSTLKAVGSYLGITWPPETDWREAWNTYQQWHQGDTSNDALLTPLVRYLWTDLEALRQVWRWLNEAV